MRKVCFLALIVALAGPVAGQEEREPFGDPGFTPTKGEGGVLVKAVKPNSTGSDLGLKVGDLIIETDGIAVTTVKDLIGVFTRKPLFKGDTMTMKVKRGDEVLDLEATLRGVTVTDSPAPEWAFKRWGNVPEGEKAPTVASLKGKVIVLFAFQHT